MHSLERSQLSDPERSRSAGDMARRFVQRWDLYARQMDDGHYVCVREPLNAGCLLDHLAGEITLGTYLLDRDSQARFVVLDADDDQSFIRLTQLAQTLAEDGLPSYLETSRRGGHLWFFFAHPVPGNQARDFGRGLLAANKISGVELFPKQDRLADGPGSLIRMPFGVHRLTGKRYGFVTPEGKPIAPTLRRQIQVLSAPETVPEAAFKAYQAQAPPLNTPAVLGPLHASKDMLSERIKASVSVMDFVSQYVELKPTGNGAIGLCPFHEDHHPSFGVNQQGNYWHCFAGCGGGSVIDFWMKWRGCDFTTAVKELAAILEKA